MPKKERDRSGEERAGINSGVGEVKGRKAWYLTLPVAP